MKLIFFIFILILINIASIKNINISIYENNIKKNSFEIIIETENNDGKKNNIIEENNEKENLESKEKIIFIHGSASGMHTYAKNPGPSLKGLLRNIGEKIGGTRFSKDWYKKIYQIGSAGNYKEREDLFNENKLPLIMGIKFGLFEIKNINDKNCLTKNKITPEAYNNIIIPFMNNYNKNNNKSIIVPHMFNWAGDLNDLDRRSAAELLSKNLLILNNNEKKKKNIVIIAFSHGGNVALESLYNNNFNNIKYLCLLGTPIGSKTEKWASSIDKNIVILNFYSNDDIAQIDPTFKFPYCKREIHTEKENIYNIEIKFIDKNGTITFPKHEHFYLYNKNFPIIFIPIIPLILKEINNLLTGEKHE